MSSASRSSLARPPSPRPVANISTFANSAVQTPAPHLRPSAKTHPQFPRCASPQSRCDFLFVPSRRTAPPHTSIESSLRALRSPLTPDIPSSIARYQSKRSPCRAPQPQTPRVDIQSWPQFRLRRHPAPAEPRSFASPAADRSSIASCSAHRVPLAAPHAPASPPLSNFPSVAVPRCLRPNRISRRLFAIPAPQRSIHSLSAVPFQFLFRSPPPTSRSCLKVNGYYAAEPGLRIDGEKFDWDASSAEQPRTGNWTKAVTLGRGALREERDAPNNWQLMSDPLPAMQMTEVPAGRGVRATGNGGTTGFTPVGFGGAGGGQASVLIDNGQLTTGYPALTVSEGRGATIRLTYAEALYDEKGQKGNRNEIEGKQIEGIADEFLLRGEDAAREFAPLSWRTWRYLQLDVETADAPVRIERLKTWFSAYPFAEKGYFQSNDRSLEPIWKIGWRTAPLDGHVT